MSRWWLILALLLSVGINIGILATLAFQGRSGDGGATAHGIATGVGPDDPAAGGTAEDPPAREGRLPPVIRRMADELRLEGEKRAAFVEVQRAFFEQTISARSRMARLQREIRREVTSEDPDREALDRLLVELSSAHTDLERAFVTNLLDSRELLDGDQERRFMRFLRRLRQVRGEVERRFRERWRSMAEDRDRLGPPRRRRPGAQRFDRPGPGGRPGAELPPAPAEP